MRALPRADRYKILNSCVTPRPIAWVTTRSEDGIVNAAPYSFFNVMGDEPPTVVLGVLAHAEARLKDTSANILSTREFVINLVGESDAEAMNATAIDAPPEVSEAVSAGLLLTDCVQIAPPRIATAPASFECRLSQAIETGPCQILIVGEVVHAHVHDAFIENPDRLYIDAPAMRLIARMHGAGWYSRQTDLFQMDRPRWADREDVPKNA